MKIVSLVLVGAAAWAGPAGAEDRYPPTHQLVICRPDLPCERRLPPSGKTACELNAASERLLAILPSGTWIVCMALAGRP